ncbi:hypothetical protein M422DRAFT_52214 [Sphaerobolus stellatus SS14]|uniref:Uncharacterized protein n=1 Tax=Sphaerobolus stellatus (strain SS14) TaxID=990650 RepID=A0A0C9V9P6_SPHS4|nr:hypothetical protein M422DRAFT_52214 [Sphaerobolus stellatus SS14]
MTPERTFTVSISTPYSNAPSIASQLETVPSSVSEEEIPERRPSEIISHDVNRLLEYLHGIDSVRNGQHSDMSRHLDRIEGELMDLAHSIRENEENRREQPPPVPVKDVSVGRSAVTPSLPPSSPATVTYLDLPPERPSSPSSMTSSISWLSSHHSDNYSLMPIEDVDELSLIRVAPQIPAPPTPSPPPSSPSSSISSATDSSISSATATPRASAASSAGTVIGDIRAMIQRLVQEVTDLRAQQNTTNDLISAIHRETAEREPPAPVTTTIIREVPVQTVPTGPEETAEQRSCREMIQRIERDLAEMLRRLASEPAPSEPSPSETTTGSISELSTIFTYRSPPILQPTPVPGRPLHSELLSDLGPMPTQHPIQLEPLPSIVRPPSRPRPRSFSPPPERRARSVPIIRMPDEEPPLPQPGIFIPPGGRQSPSPILVRRPFDRQFDRPSGRPFDRPLGTPFDRTLAETPTERQFPARTHRTPGAPTETIATGSPVPNIDMFHEVLADRARRRRDAPDGFYYPPGPEVPRRPPSAPAEARDPNPERTQAYARARRPPPPGSSVPSGQRGDAPIGEPVGGPALNVGLTPNEYQEILNYVRNGERLATATLDQTRQTTEYLQRLNQWLERDVSDRHDEITSLGERIDLLRNEIAGHIPQVRPAGGPVPGPAGPPGWFPVPPPPQQQVRGGPPLVGPFYQGRPRRGGSPSDDSSESSIFIPPPAPSRGPTGHPGFVANPAGQPAWLPYGPQGPGPGWFPQGTPAGYPPFDMRPPGFFVEEPSDEGYGPRPRRQRRRDDEEEDDEDYVHPVPLPRSPSRGSDYSRSYVDVVRPGPAPTDSNAPRPIIIQQPGPPAAQPIPADTTALDPSRSQQPSREHSRAGSPSQPVAQEQDPGQRIVILPPPPFERSFSNS